MLRLTLLALGASLAIGSATAQEAAAQSGRDRAEAARRGGVIVPQTDRRDSRNDDRRNDRRFECDDRDSDRDSDRNRGRSSSRNDRRVNNDRWDDCDDRDGKYNKNSKNKGPAFCRNGQGHPVHGREWCRQKGYDTGYGEYSRVGWEDVVLRRGRYNTQGNLSRGHLQNILGSNVLGRFDRQRNYLGYSQPLYGRWTDSNDGSVLRLLSGAQTIAQIIDRNRDGRADLVLLYNGR
jgi:hypothetical protein